MIDAVYYFIFVIVPIFLLGFQAVLLPIFFFLKGRNWLSPRAFIVTGTLVGIGYGYIFAHFIGAQTALVASTGVAAFGAICATGWWYLLVKREGLQDQSSERDT